MAGEMGSALATEMIARSFPWVLKISQQIAVVAVVSYLLTKFPQIWEALGLDVYKRQK